MTKIILIIFTVFLFAACSSSQKEADIKQKKKQNIESTAQEETKITVSIQSGLKLSCDLAKDKRNIEVKAKGKGCELLYSKFTQTKVVATSIRGMEHCTETQVKMKIRLEESGFKCEWDFLKKT